MEHVVVDVFNGAGVTEAEQGHVSYTVPFFHWSSSMTLTYQLKSSFHTGDKVCAFIAVLSSFGRLLDIQILQ